MNVICVGYFDKHSRFFLDIRKWLKQKTTKKINFNCYSIHISGFLYAFFRLQPNSIITFKAWLNAYLKRKYYKEIIETSDIYKGIKYSNFIDFHLKLNKGISKRALKLQALSYIDILDKVYDNKRPDYLISLGDSRLCVEIAIAIAKHRNIQIYYLEQGPFNTTFFDEEGVNANLSIRNKPSNKIKAKSPNSQTDIVTEKYNRSPLYRGIDILIMKLFEKTRLYPPDLKFTDIITYRKNAGKTKSSLTKTTEYALFAMQLPLDVNLINHSPLYDSHFVMIKDIYENLPKGLKLVVREHPLYLRKYGKEFYNYLDSKNIEIDNTSTLEVALKEAKVVIVNNSTVGLEAIKIYKSVVVLGDTFYDNEKICLKLKSKTNLSQILKQALEQKINKQEIDAFFEQLYNSVMLKGSITDKNLTASKTIANHLISKH
ncbi:capsular polysaccharide export protein, LipB/KpsS family [Winogradskyella alexanderae]|uniref:Capsular polysaccharide biosynthesis protein n=1 Tax=Winogradskyella alexanderae TaxID=2877123 RepID=A0ABS7XS51_9FLAO|nr:hypothetical protein [Winogradskyella alexanderae]MCA0132853.1 hypothetical protein [Winogradskyella alexanderae]